VSSVLAVRGRPVGLPAAKGQSTGSNARRCVKTLKYYHDAWEAVERLRLSCDEAYGHRAIDVHALARRLFGMGPWSWYQFIDPFCNAARAVLRDGVSAEDFCEAVELEFRSGARQVAQRDLAMDYSARLRRPREHALQRAERVSRQRKEQARSSWAKR